VNGLISEDQPMNDDELYEVATDIKKSISATVEILDGLLCHDKLESGILKLHKTRIAIGPLLKDCYSSLVPHARECNVNMALSMNPGPGKIAFKITFNQ
jgi:hypothetical protein